jgi:hypothetical protein
MYLCPQRNQGMSGQHAADNKAILTAVLSPFMPDALQNTKR